MAINSKFNTAIMLDGGSGKPTTPTYGSYLSGSTPSPSVPTPITLPSYSAGLIGQPTVPVSPVGNTLQMPNMNFNSNVVQVGAAQNKGNGGVTNEGVVIGGGATPLPQIKSGSSGGSSSSVSSGSAGASTYGSWIGNIFNKQKTTLVHNPNEEVTKTTLPAQAGQSVEKTPFSETGASTGTGATGTGAATEQKAYAGAWAGSEPIDSYEEFLRNKESAYGSMRDEQTQFYDEQSKKTLAAIEEQRKATYAEAERQRAEAEQRADVERERGVVDARSSYEQNKASYGANAEAMGSMGLAGSGYSDYLNSKAYAQQRAETQAANAQADASKREARYVEDQARLKADSEYYQNKLAAEQTADAGKFGAEMSYQENLLNNDDAIGKHRLEQEQKEEAKVAQEQADYEALLAAANNGTYTKEQLEQLTRDKGLSEEHANSVLGAADKHTEKVNAGTKVDIDNNYAQGGDTQDYIDEIENAGGLTPEEAQNERRDVYLKDIDTYGTVDMDELKDDLATGKVSQDGYNEIIQKNESAVIKSAKSYISSGNTGSAAALAEEQYESGAISKGVYQQVYHEIGVAAANGATTENVKNLVKELEKWKNSGKLSASDYHSLSKYYYGKLGTTVSATESGYKDDEYKAGQKWKTFTWNGTKYWVDKKENTDTDLKNLLNGIATGKESSAPNIGTLVRYNGKTYAYVNRKVEYGFLNMKTKNVTEWTEIHSYGNDDYGAQIEANAEVHEKPAPASTATNTAFQKIQSYIDENNLREGDRNRWGQVFKFAGLLELYNTLTAEEKAALKGNS